MKRKPQLHLVAVKLNDQQISLLDAEVKKQSTTIEAKATRSSVLRRALMALVSQHAS